MEQLNPWGLWFWTEILSVNACPGEGRRWAGRGLGTLRVASTRHPQRESSYSPTAFRASALRTYWKHRVSHLTGACCVNYILIYFVAKTKSPVWFSPILNHETCQGRLISLQHRWKYFTSWKRKSIHPALLGCHSSLFPSFLFPC